MRKAEKVVESNYVHKLKFQVKDTLLAARYGFNSRNIWVFWKGIVASWAILVFFAYSGFIAAGYSLADRFSEAVFCPLPDSLFMSNVPSVILLVVGILLALAVYMLTSLKVSRLTFEQLRGDQFFSEADAKRFCRGNWKAVLVTPLIIVSGILMGILAIFLFGLISGIPSIGPFIAGILAIPAWIIGLFIVLALVVLCVSIFLAPVISATTKGDSFECLFEVFSTVTSQPVRLFRGLLSGLFMRIVALLVFTLFAWGSVSIVSSVLFRTTGFEGFSATFESGFSRLAPEAVPFYSSIFNPIVSTDHSDLPSGGSTNILISLAGVAVFLSIWAYWLSSCTAQWTIIYLATRYHRDGEDLLQRAEEDEYREFTKICSSSDGVQ